MQNQPPVDLHALLFAWMQARINTLTTNEALRTSTKALLNSRLQGVPINELTLRQTYGKLSDDYGPYTLRPELNSAQQARSDALSFAMDVMEAITKEKILPMLEKQAAEGKTARNGKDKVTVQGDKEDALITKPQPLANGNIRTESIHAAIASLLTPKPKEGEIGVPSHIAERFRQARENCENQFNLELQALSNVTLVREMPQGIYQRIITKQERNAKAGEGSEGALHDLLASVLKRSVILWEESGTEAVGGVLSEHVKDNLSKVSHSLNGYWKATREEAEAEAEAKAKTNAEEPSEAAARETGVIGEMKAGDNATVGQREAAALVDTFAVVAASAPPLPLPTTTYLGKPLATKPEDAVEWGYYKRHSNTYLCVPNTWLGSKDLSHLPYDNRDISSVWKGLSIHSSHAMRQSRGIRETFNFNGMPFTVTRGLNLADLSQYEEKLFISPESKESFIALLEERKQAREPIPETGDPIMSLDSATRLLCTHYRYISDAWEYFGQIAKTVKPDAHGRYHFEHESVTYTATKSATGRWNFPKSLVEGPIRDRLILNPDIPRQIPDGFLSYSAAMKEFRVSQHTLDVFWPSLLALVKDLEPDAEGKVKFTYKDEEKECEAFFGGERRKAWRFPEAFIDTRIKEVQLARQMEDTDYGVPKGYFHKSGTFRELHTDSNTLTPVWDHFMVLVNELKPDEDGYATLRYEEKDYKLYFGGKFGQWHFSDELINGPAKELLHASRTPPRDYINLSTAKTLLGIRSARCNDLFTDLIALVGDKKPDLRGRVAFTYEGKEMGAFFGGPGKKTWHFPETFVRAYAVEHYPQKRPDMARSSDLPADALFSVVHRPNAITQRDADEAERSDPGDDELDLVEEHYRPAMRDAAAQSAGVDAGINYMVINRPGSTVQAPAKQIGKSQKTGDDASLDTFEDIGTELKKWMALHGHEYDILNDAQRLLDVSPSRLETLLTPVRRGLNDIRHNSEGEKLFEKLKQAHGREMVNGKYMPRYGETWGNGGVSNRS